MQTKRVILFYKKQFWLKKHLIILELQIIIYIYRNNILCDSPTDKFLNINII